VSLGNAVRRSSGAVGVAVLGFRLGRLMSVAALTVAVTGCGPLSEGLGIHQVWVSHIAMPDSIVSTDTLVADLSGGTEVGDCLSLSHVDVQRDSAGVAITIWAEVRQWLGSGPPPPCGMVGYRYEGAPPFMPRWFFIIANQPDSSVMVDSLLVVD